jgi:hypothetical protein
MVKGPLGEKWTAILAKETLPAIQTPEGFWATSPVLVAVSESQGTLDLLGGLCANTHRRYLWIESAHRSENVGQVDFSLAYKRGNAEFNCPGRCQERPLKLVES